jgi:hypothetical protein
MPKLVPPPGDTGRHDANVTASMVAEGNGVNWAGRHRATVAKHTVLPNFDSIGKLIRDLFRVNHAVYPAQHSG